MLSTKSNPFGINPLGTSALERFYLDTITDLQLAMLYANQLLSQVQLDFSQVDITLATEIQGFQQRSITGASFFQRLVVPGVITNLAGADNIANLADAALELVQEKLLAFSTDPTSLDNGANLLKVILQQMEDFDSESSSLLAKLQSSERSFNQFETTYVKVLDAAIKQTGSAAAASAKVIDALQEKINENIADIVKGGREAGQGVKDLGIGLLTTFTGAMESPGEEEPGEEEPGDGDGAAEDETSADDAVAGETGENDGQVKCLDEEIATPPANPADTTVPDVTFVTNAINLVSDGVARQSTAGKALITNNERLAAAYQKMAGENALVTIAKIVQVNNRQFLNALRIVEGDINHLITEWQLVGSHFQESTQTLDALTDQSAAVDFSNTARAARKQWTQLKSTISELKLELTS
jgi:hypothetical protein